MGLVRVIETLLRLAVFIGVAQSERWKGNISISINAEHSRTRASFDLESFYSFV